MKPLPSVAQLAAAATGNDVSSDEFAKGLHSAFLEGMAGAKAMATDVVLLIWLRTVMNRQFRHGGGMVETIQKLYKEGGVRRFYRGFSFAIVEAPLSRGVGAAANYATLHMLSRSDTAQNMPLVMKTALSSLLVASFRVLYYPLDTAKTILQVEGAEGLSLLRRKVKNHGISVLYYGASYAIVGVAVKHTLWFTTYNYLTDLLGASAAARQARALPDQDIPDPAFWQQVLQNSFIGLSCAVVTNILANPLSVLKAYKQSHTESVTYTQAFRQIVGQHGILHLFKRGISTRLCVDGINSMVFTVLWRFLAPQS
ncbi:hypothetical protein PTSG_04750 [Salpingoeca rosetta]|uniref:Carrier protein n=1 Tax=Salpingoeca rosetta (strain ATCC 50818 / BSB-021) TaxID=946362 RepID=F2U9L2_SALR5|nr:uncharacterized protein PTSG_04750 [Salpingoeca rosetta]EGD73039.1 hypothetical protein PTSG_04750 [Salpingoeca rosetta]|eukprot:XP_004994070.1 hypothetical protein PTSG_04750 [Salpingoeca rosetta]